jgi:DNA-binding response OmpR family regulator
MTRNKILLVDDDTDMQRLLAALLSQAGYQSVTADSGEMALSVFASQQPVLVILDILLQGSMDGVEVCRQLRAQSTVPIMMLTGQQTDAYFIRSLEEAGADDYVTKPFSGRHVLARIRALLRRAGKSQEPIIHGPLRLDLVARKFFVNNHEIALTPHEFMLLELFMRHPGQALSRRELLDLGWEAGFNGVDRVVDVHVSSLRRKLKGVGRYITAVRGIGYRFEIR